MKAIILVAGKGTRLLPMTLIKPKPLLEINGKTLFENMIEFLHLSDINDITVVTGYKHEAFDKFKEKLNFKKVINENYETTNSSSSLKLVLDEINDDTLIINGDLYIKNDFVKSINRNVSQFISQYLDETVNTTWVYHVDDNNRLIDIDVNAKGGGLCETCIAYFAKNDIEFFKKEFIKNDDNEHWDNCIIRIMKEKDFYVTEVHDSIYEIDSFSDAISHNLITYDNIAEQCSDNNKALKISDHNIYTIDFLGDKKIIKLDNNNTKLSEKNIISIIPSYLYPKTMMFDFNIKIIDYLNGYNFLSYKDLNSNFFMIFSKVLREIHNIRLEDNKDFTPISIRSEIMKYNKNINVDIISDDKKDFILFIADEIDSNDKVLCHRHLNYDSILYNGKDIKFIDFEFSGFSSKYLDLAYFICKSKLDDNKCQEFTNLYGDIDEAMLKKSKLIILYLLTCYGIVNNIQYYEEYYKELLNKKLSLF